jgi:hypothetical protein
MLLNTRLGRCFAQAAVKSCGSLETTLRFGDLPELYIFECRAGGVSRIEAA